MIGNRPVRGIAGTLGLVVAVATLAGCPGASVDRSPRVGAPTYVARECPVDVEAALVGAVECGTLRVRENRSEGTGTVSLLVTSLTPVDLTDADPLVVVGTDLATRPNYAGIGPLSQRTGRRVVFLEQRGTAHSIPSLACPIDQAAQTRAWSARTGSSAWRKLAARATQACYEDLTAQGIDVAAYDVAQMAADLADLIEVLDLPPVNLITYGSTSRIALELLRRQPDEVRAVVLDSPDVPGVDPRGQVAATTDQAMATVLGWCGADRDCRRRYGDPTTLLPKATASLSERPLALKVVVFGTAHRIVLDAALLVRIARQTLTDGGSAGTWGLPESLPRLLAAVVERDVARLRVALGELLGAQGPWCAGYRAKCMTAHAVDEGVWNTVLCRDIAPSGTAGSTSAAQRPEVRQVYGRSWWWDVCQHWPVPAAGAAATTPVDSDIPVLVLAGGLAATTSPADLRAALTGLSHASLVVDVTGSHNVLGHGCLTDVRDRWLDHPHTVARTLPCLPKRLEW